MKQASNSLLTFSQILFRANLSVPALPRVKAGANGRHFTPFNIYWKNVEQLCSILPGLSCSPRSYVRSWLGEGRIRSLLYGFGIVLIAVATMTFSVWSAPGANDLVISLKKEASVRSATIVLKDVADLSGPDLDKVEKLSQISLGPSPEFGSVKTLSRHQIGQFIQAAVGPLRSEEISGAAAVQVRVKGRAISPEEIAPLLKAYIRKTSSWNESEIQIRSIRNLVGIELPSDGAELRFAPINAIWGHRSILAPVEIVRAGKTLRRLWITAEIDIHAVILVAAQKITLGKIVLPGDVVKKDMQIADLHAAYARNPEEVVGKAAGRIFSPGDPIPCEFFTNPSLVKSGETVQLRLERKGIVLTSQARAEQDGTLGQVIRVRNLDFSTIVKAQVTSRSQVMLQ
jgi:flagellar basal body P-ring formation protein FlgA